MLPTTTSPVLSPCRAREADATRKQLRLVRLERPRDAERGVDRAHRVVLVRDRRPEDRHDAVAQELVDRALVAVHLGQHQVEGAAHQPVDLFRIEPLESDVKPATSTNSTVTCLRSPWSAPALVRIFSARCRGV